MQATHTYKPSKDAFTQMCFKQNASEFKKGRKRVLILIIYHSTILCTCVNASLGKSSQTSSMTRFIQANTFTQKDSEFGKGRKRVTLLNVYHPTILCTCVSTHL